MGLEKLRVHMSSETMIGGGSNNNGKIVLNVDGAVYFLNLLQDDHA